MLPFQNMSGDPEQEYFVDGMVEDIITALSRFKSLFVIARNSTFTYKGKPIDTKQVGRELGVRYVLEGSVRKAGNQIRITGQLIQADSGTHLWAERYDGDSAEVFDLQDKVTFDVVSAITPRLEQAEVERVSRGQQSNVGAYDSYLQGIAKFRLGSREANQAALQSFHRSIELDPTYATAYAMAVACYSVIKSNGWQNDATQENAETDRLARRAVSLARDDAFVLAWAGWGFAVVIRNLDLAAGLIKQAVSSIPILRWAGTRMPGLMSGLASPTWPWSNFDLR